MDFYSLSVVSYIKTSTVKIYGRRVAGILAVVILSPLRSDIRLNDIKVDTRVKFR